MDDQPETEVEELWFSEAQRRLDELHNGKVEGVDAADAFRMGRAMIVIFHPEAYDEMLESPLALDRQQNFGKNLSPHRLAVRGV